MCVFIGDPRANFGETRVKFGKSATLYRVRDPRVFRDASGEVRGFLTFFTGFCRFCSFFRTFLPEFPCSRVRLLPIVIVFGRLLSCDSPVEGSVHCSFWSFLTQFRPEISLLKAPFIGPSGPPAGIHERSERDLTRVAQRFDTCCTLLEFASVASEL